MKKIYCIGTALFLLVAIISNIVVHARASLIGSDVHVIVQKTAQLQKHNQELELELAQAKSLTVAEHVAREKGFVPVVSLTQVATKNNQVALELHQ